MAVAAVIVGGLAWRLVVALTAPWYWDEGYVAELARAVGACTRPHVGGLWDDGFFPLTTSILAPLSAAPFASTPWWSAMVGVRLWAVSLECLTMLGLIRLALPSVRPRLALLALVCYAFLPFAAEYGGRAFYHHLALPLLVAALSWGRSLFDGDEPPSVIPASLCSGLAMASCYWLWWLPASWAVLLAWKRPRGWVYGLALTTLPALAVLALNFWPDPSGTWWSVGGILTLSHEGGAHDLPSLMAALKSLFTTLPFFLPGLVGLSWAAVREKGPWPWLLFCLLCAILEPIRQRGAFGVGIPYPFMLAAPLASLGTALLLDAAIKLGPWRGGLSAAATLCLFLWPVDFSWLRSISLAPKPVDELTAYLDKNARPGDLVCGMPQFNWRLRPLLRDCDPLDMVAYQGKGNGIYPPGAAATRFAYPCGLENVRYAIVCRIHLMGVFRLNGVALTFLEMERAGWRQVFDDKTFKVYENPLFGAKPDPTVCILQVPEYYRRAGAQAVSDGRRDLALFAQERLQSSTMGLRR